MKRIVINLILPIIIVVVFLVKNNISLYNSSVINKNSKIVITTNKEKVININNKHNQNYIYYFYTSNNKYQLDSVNIYINNKLIDKELIKNNNGIICKELVGNKNSKTISFRIESGNKEKYIINVNKVKMNVTLINHIKNKSTKEAYYIDSDSAKETYKFKKRYKYVGNIPNNYIYFNCKDDNLSSCELWRIIGVVKDDKDEYLKIIKNSSEKYSDSEYNIYYKSRNIVKNTKPDILDIDDYIDSYRRVSIKCVKNIFKCNKKSYLTPKKTELIKANNSIFTVSHDGNVVKNSFGSEYRPVLYLKGKAVLLGGNGSVNMPYIIK